MRARYWWPVEKLPFAQIVGNKNQSINKKAMENYGCAAEIKSNNYNVTGNRCAIRSEETKYLTILKSKFVISIQVSLNKVQF